MSVVYVIHITSFFSDLVKYGLIHEFIGRVPVVAALNNLSVKDLVRILHVPKNSLVKQYQGLFELNNVRN